MTTGLKVFRAKVKDMPLDFARASLGKALIWSKPTGWKDENFLVRQVSQVRAFSLIGNPRLDFQMDLTTVSQERIKYQNICPFIRQFLRDEEANPGRQQQAIRPGPLSNDPSYCTEYVLR